MALIPGGFGFGSRRINAFDPFFHDPWDPLDGFTLGPSSPLFSLPRPSPLYFPSESSALVGARVDWKETPEAHVFKADLPGLKKDELKVEVEDGRILQISGERKIDKEEGTDNWHCVERSSGKFLQRFRLPENARVDQVRAAMKDGVLTVTVPKADIKKCDITSIEISG
ncbi:hypothetical protein C4D60_Mb07t14490 [Musa balbisiana]|uniref:SHSP domain-containing protein n=1 Tax=Musa balbisiana TaxID=52838 RepID=A0A4S8JFI4_MUSBA|nr:hypothetical protein C4D60_Mb07t14490 [Musa balbisiana]